MTLLEYIYLDCAIISGSIFLLDCRSHWREMLSATELTSESFSARFKSISFVLLLQVTQSAYEHPTLYLGSRSHTRVATAEGISCRYPASASASALHNVPLFVVRYAHSVLQIEGDTKFHGVRIGGSSSEGMYARISALVMCL